MTEPTAVTLVEPIPVTRIGQPAKTIRFEAGPEDRAVLARRFGLIELTAFSAEATLRRRRDTGWIELKGRLKASVVQECVVTLEPVPAEVEEEIDELFDDSREVDGFEVELDPVAEDPEPLEGEVLDVGEVIAQILSLALDPYPRAPGVPPVGEPLAEDGAEDGAGEAAEDEAPASPFAALAALKDRDVKKR
ncbi:DUF177 domain-containing protein [Thalassobaculum sp. OXR-137]|uniref:YceD family protein n=1 Tax=Thalassobaculum sp. OXR-137 TaxID=3100173 RepID=UPI002AC97CFD|nr:DUF177 domain-containing protein [Thalassobaculum sp. OXR-137]WPZ33265.1 DUF177 domain-containing protein [Thalassobaculum sp. OXR-137]